MNELNPLHIHSIIFLKRPRDLEVIPLASGFHHLTYYSDYLFAFNTGCSFPNLVPILSGNAHNVSPPNSNQTATDHIKTDGNQIPACFQEANGD